MYSTRRTVGCTEFAVSPQAKGALHESGNADEKLLGEVVRCAPVEVEIDAALVLGVGIPEIVGKAGDARDFVSCRRRCASRSGGSARVRRRCRPARANKGLFW